MTDILKVKKNNSIPIVKWVLFILSIVLVVVRTVLMREEIGWEIQRRATELEPGLLSAAESFGVFFTAMVDIFTIIVIAIAIHVSVKLVFLLVGNVKKRGMFNDCSLIVFYSIVSSISIWNMFS